MFQNQLGVDALFEQARLSAVDRPVDSFTEASRMLSGEPVPSSIARSECHRELESKDRKIRTSSYRSRQKTIIQYVSFP
ncbi:hypothetical protein YC2023_009945 [Brassica napus]